MTEETTIERQPVHSGDTLVAIGTRKGLWFAYSSDRRNWTLTEPQLLMSEVPSVAIDARSRTSKSGAAPRVFVGVRSEHWGPTVAHTDDLGQSWHEPEHGAIRFPLDTGAALQRVWQIQPDTADRPGVIWAGCEPISVWRSTDGGEHFELIRGLWDHPHRPDFHAPATIPR